MKQLHRKDLFGWSEFNRERNLDFHSVLWVRDGGNVLIDPLPMSEHDHSHLQSLGGVGFIVITNSDHCRDAEHIADSYRCGDLRPGSRGRNVSAGMHPLASRSRRNRSRTDCLSA